MDYYVSNKRPKGEIDNFFVFVGGTGHWDNQEYVNKVEGYYFFQWIQSVRGEGELVIDDKKYTIRENQGMLIYPKVPHIFYPVKEPWETYWIIFWGKPLFQQFLNYIVINRYEIFSLTNTELFLDNMRKICDILKSESEFKGLESSLHLHKLILNILKNGNKISDQYKKCNVSLQQRLNRLKPVIEYIDTNYSKVITLDELSGIIGVTPQYFCTLFKNVTGLSLVQYINKVRIAKFKEIISKNHSMTTEEAFHLVGFNNDGYFYKIFKKLEGTIPSNFRRIYDLY